MPDLTTLGLAALSAPLVMKILGPTSDYIGGELKEFTERRVNNINAMFHNAARKLGSKLDEPGQVPPKVLKTIINDASYSDDAVFVEYFGGVLASARTPTGRDDRGARLAKIVDGLSAYQIRTHYLVYSTVAKRFRVEDNTILTLKGRRKMELFIPYNDYASAMQFTPAESNNQLLDHVMHGLANEGLIELDWQYGPKKALEAAGKKSLGDGIVCIPSAFGAEVFLWAFGYGDKQLDFMLTNDCSASIEGIQELGSAARPTKSS